jgi:hypothetical protein
MSFTAYFHICLYHTLIIPTSLLLTPAIAILPLPSSQNPSIYLVVNFLFAGHFLKISRYNRKHLWITFLIIIISDLFHFPKNGKILFIFNGWIELNWVYIPYFKNHSSTNGYSSWFNIMTVLNSAAWGMWVSPWYSDYISFEWKRVVELDHKEDLFIDLEETPYYFP